MDELLKEDPHKKLKTSLWTFAVVVLACLCVVPSLCFYLTFSEWFKYSANKEELGIQLAQTQQQLKDRKAELESNYVQRKKECEEALSGYIEKFTQTTNAMEGVIAERQERIDTLQRKINEIAGIETRYSEQTNALYIAVRERKMAEDAAAEAKKKLDSLNASIEAEILNLSAVEAEKQASKKQSKEESERYAQMMKRLDDDYRTKKQELTDQINRYLERYQATTNLMDGIIADRQHRLDGLVEQLGKMSDVETRYIAQTNALANAISQRDAALKEARDSQDAFTEWNGKVGTAKAEISELEGRKSTIEASIADLTKDKAALIAEISRMTAEKKSVADSLNGIKSSVESEKVVLASLGEQIARCKKDAETATSEKEIAKNKLREAQSLRDKAIFEKEQEEKSTKVRKEELRAAIRELESELQKLHRKTSSQISDSRDPASISSENN